jgi:hypothetical protein
VNIAAARAVVNILASAGWRKLRESAFAKVAASLALLANDAASNREVGCHKLAQYWLQSVTIAKKVVQTSREIQAIGTKHARRKLVDMAEAFAGSMTVLAVERFELATSFRLVRCRAGV